MGKKPALLLGLFLFALVLSLPAPSGLSPAAKRAGAVAILMAVWWVTEALPVAATALVPLATFPFLSILEAPQTAAAYADPNVYLLMGGFMIAMAMQKWGLHKRLALQVISRAGANPRRLLAGFLCATASISLWVSNTATAVMVLPIALAVINQVSSSETDPKLRDGLGAALMLGIAYACSIGGTGTLVGTPPNMIFAGQVNVLFPELGEVGFVRWFLFAFPLAVGFLLITWLILSRSLTSTPAKWDGGRDVIRQDLAALGRWTCEEQAVFAIFCLTALAWIWRSDLLIGRIRIPGWTTLLGLQGVHDGTIAMAAALLLFATPARSKKGEFLLDWTSAAKLPWHVVLLLGGGFALAEGFQSTELDVWLGGGFRALGELPPLLIIFLICLATTFFSEVMSNTAQVTLMLPVLASASKALDIHPYALMIPATLAASFAFMLPAGTPPNAIVFGSGYLTIPKMAKTGFVLNLLGSAWITLMTWLVAPAVFGFRL